MLVFAFKTALYAIAPNVFTRIRRVRAEKRSMADFKKHPVLHRHNAAAGWPAEASGPFRFRAYADYDEYLTHQAQKYVKISVQGGLSNRVIVSYRLKFFDRFRRVARLLDKDALIVCAGARDGTEVEVWHDLGFRRAIGVDLNPGRGNDLVQTGDFNHLPYADGSVDLIYSNCLDHSFDFDLLFGEARRVLKPDGYALYEVATSSDRAFEAVDWRRPEDVVLVLLKYFETLVEVRRTRHWLCALVRKAPAAGAPG